MIEKTLLFLILSTSSFAFIHFEGYGQIGLGFWEFDEAQTTANEFYDHNVTSPSVGLGARAGIDLKILSFGGIADIRWQHLDGRKSLQDGIFFWDKEGYDNTLKSSLYGAYAYIAIKRLRLIGEYYKEVNSVFTYADTEASNPFGDKNELKGHGWGAGIGILKDNNASITLLFRDIIYDKWTIGNITYDLPLDDFTKIREQSGQIQFGIYY